MNSIGVGDLWNGQPHPSGKAEYPCLYPVGTAIGEHLRVESVLRICEGRIHYLINNLGPKWSRRKCWACGNIYSVDSARCCSYCLRPLRDLRMLMTVRWNTRGYSAWEQMVSQKLRHFGLITPVALYYRDGHLISVYHYEGEGSLLDEPSPLESDELVQFAYFLVGMISFLQEIGIVIDKLQPHHVLKMPDGSPRLFDLDVLDVVSPEALKGHYSSPVRRNLVELVEFLLPFCAAEDKVLQDVLHRARFDSSWTLKTFGKALLTLRNQGQIRPIATRATAFSDVGLVRSENEDAWAWKELNEDATLYVVADGMGGHEAGSTASTMAVDILVDELNKNNDAKSLDSIEKATLDALKKANSSIHNYASASDRHLGTTLVAAIVLNQKNLFIANTGDSRAYIYRAGQIKQLSTDHSLAQAIAESGKMTIEEARKTPQGSILTSNLGGEDDDLEVSVSSVLVKPGDRVLLCSDGLWSLVPDKHIAKLLASYPDRSEAILNMVREAFDAGGEDNITIQLIDIG